MSRRMHDEEDGAFIGKHGRGRFAKNQRDRNAFRDPNADSPAQTATRIVTPVVTSKFPRDRRNSTDVSRKHINDIASVGKIKALANEKYEGRVVYQIIDGTFEGKYCYFTC